MEIEQAVNKRKKITRLLLILLMILLSLVCIKYLISKSNKYISENGKSSMGAVVEQIQQTYPFQETVPSHEVRIPQPTTASCSWLRNSYFMRGNCLLKRIRTKISLKHGKKNRKVLLYSFRKMVRQYQQVEQKCGLICQVNFCWT